MTGALAARGVIARTVDAATVDHTFAGTAAALAEAWRRDRSTPWSSPSQGTPPAADLGPGWERTLAEHAGIADQIYADAAWSRAVADHANATGRSCAWSPSPTPPAPGVAAGPRRSPSTPGRRQGATDGRLAAFAVGVETTDPADLPAVGELAAHLVASPEAPALSGAELVVGPGWLGLRSHPRVGASLSFHDHTVAPWLDDVLADLAGGARPAGGDAA